MPRFVDTNILLYAISDDPAELPKSQIARAILNEADLALSTQVLAEFYDQATRPSRERAVSHHAAVRVIESLTRYPVEPVTYPVVAAALASQERYAISYWDAAIIEAARSAGCTIVLTEDLSDGQDYGGIIVENPFSHA